MSEPRLRTHVLVSAILRRAAGAGAFAVVARKGDPDAGAAAVKVVAGGGAVRLLVQGRDPEGRPVWRDPLADDGAASDEATVDAWLARETRFDPDLWIVEIEDREGRSFTDGA